MSTLKAFGAVAVMVACFSIIYPRFMHPLVLRALGMNDPPKKDIENENVFPPGFKPETRKTQQGADDIRKHIRPGPHPGMRAAAEMQRQQAQQGSSRGMMGVVLPMYAIGIVLYLVYTLFKVFNKSKNNSWSKIGDHYNGGDNTMDRMGFPTDFDGSCDVSNFLHDNKQRKELEDLLSRVDEKNVSTEEMRILQKRLEDTEAQMTRILQAMKSVQTNVDKMTLSDSFPSPQNQDFQSDITEGAGDNGQPDVQEEEASDDKENHNPDNNLTKNRQDKVIKNVDLDSIDKDSDDEEPLDQEASNDHEATGDIVDSNNDDEAGDNVNSNNDDEAGDNVNSNNDDDDDEAGDNDLDSNAADKEAGDNTDSNKEVESKNAPVVKSSSEQGNDSSVRHRKKH